MTDRRSLLAASGHSKIIARESEEGYFNLFQEIVVLPTIQCHLVLMLLCVYCMMCVSTHHQDETTVVTAKRTGNPAHDSFDWTSMPCHHLSNFFLLHYYTTKDLHTLSFQPQPTSLSPRTIIRSSTIVENVHSQHEQADSNAINLDYCVCSDIIKQDTFSFGTSSRQKEHHNNIYSLVVQSHNNLVFSDPE